PATGERQTIRMGQRLGLGQRLLTPPEGLRWIAQALQCEGCMGKAPDPRRVAKAEHQAPLRRRVGEGDPLFEVHLGSRVFAQVERGGSGALGGRWGGVWGGPRGAPAGRPVPPAPARWAPPRGSQRTAISLVASGRAGASRRPGRTMPVPARRSAPPPGPPG